MSEKYFDMQAMDKTVIEFQVLKCFLLVIGTRCASFHGKQVYKQVSKHIYGLTLKA